MCEKEINSLQGLEKINHKVIKCFYILVMFPIYIMEGRKIIIFSEESL